MALVKLKRGLRANLPAQAQPFEPLFAHDTMELFVADANGDVKAIEIAKEKVKGLMVNGKIDGSLLPALAITSVHVVASVAERDALEVEEGDVAVVTDVANPRNYIMDGAGNWQELVIPADVVQSVNGQVGAVVLTTAHIAEGSNLYWTQARFDAAFGLKSTDDLAEGDNQYFTEARARASVSAAGDLQYDAETGVFSVVTPKTTADIAEDPSRLYFTDARAQASAATKIAELRSAANGLAALDENSRLPAAQLPEGVLFTGAVAESDVTFGGEAGEIAYSAGDGTINWSNVVDGGSF
jgi:hypothetical protein